MNLLDLMNELGSRVRYGMGPNEKYKLMASASTPGQPSPFLPSGEVNPEAERYLSNYLGAQQWGEVPATLFNQMRYLADDNAKVFDAGIRGSRAAQDEGFRRSQPFRDQGFELRPFGPLQRLLLGLGGRLR